MGRAAEMTEVAMCYEEVLEAASAANRAAMRAAFCGKYSLSAEFLRAAAAAYRKAAALAAGSLDPEIANNRQELWLLQASLCEEEAKEDDLRAQEGQM
jgi:hypothetical protein